MYKKFYVHEIAAVDLSKIYFLKNAMKTCKPNNSDLNCDWKRMFEGCKLIHFCFFWLCKADNQTEFHCSLWNQTLSLLNQAHIAWATHKNMVRLKEYKTRSSFFKPRSKTINTDSAKQVLNGPGSTQLPAEIPLYNWGTTMY